MWTRVFICMLVFSGCASDPYWPWNSQKSKYDRLVNSRVYEKKLFERGRVLVGAKILLLDSEIENRQMQLFPLLVENPNDPSVGSQKWVVAIETAGRDPVSLNQVRLQLGGQKPLRVKEIDNLTTMEALYAFAYPYLKVYEVEFSAFSGKSLQKPAEPSAENQARIDFEITVPMGKVIFDTEKILAEAKL